MTRQEAIEEISDAFTMVAGEYCVGEAEHWSSERRLRDTLLAIGVSQEELPERLLSLPSDDVIDQAAKENNEYWRSRMEAAR